MDTKVWQGALHFLIGYLYNLVFCRSVSCPQCRKKTTEKTIHRIYPSNNDQSENEGQQDIGTLQTKLESMTFNMKLKEMDVINLSDKYKTAQFQIDSLK